MQKALSLPEFIVAFMDIFRKADYQIYLVGGPVRNLLLNRSIDNWDFTTNANPDQIQKLFSEALYNNNYGTVLIPLTVAEEKVLCEVTPYRKEGQYSDGRHPDDISWADTLEEDLVRRDFTINSLAYDGVKLVDITGGLKDLEGKIVKAVGDPDKRFQEDALRLIRAVRFATQLEFQIEKETLASIVKNAQLIQQISWERIRDEFFKILSSGKPADGVLLLRETGLLGYILPEIEACFAVEQKSPERHHIYDVGTHLVETLRNCTSTDPITRFAALLHDVGKKDTHEKDAETDIITFYNHEIVGANIANSIAERFRLSKKERFKLVKLVRYHMFSVSELQTDKALRRFIRKVGLDNLEDILLIRTADRVGSGALETSWRTELFKKRLLEVQKEPFEIKDLKISGVDVMEILNIKPGPRIGDILKEIFAEVEEKKLENKREILLQKVREYL